MQKTLGTYVSVKNSKEIKPIGVNCTTTSGNRRNEIVESLGFKNAFEESKNYGYFGKASTRRADHSDAFYCRMALFIREFSLGQKPTLFIEDLKQGNEDNKQYRRR